MSITRFLTGLGIWLCLCPSTRAWNAEGHMAAAQIAYNHLRPEVKARCDALIALPVFNSSSINSNFVMAACWADDIKSATSAYNTWHYIDIPFSPDNTSTNSFVPDPFDVVQAINQCVAALQNPATSLSNQAFNLRFLLHFVGDIQQPLHCSTAITAAYPGGDAGGNSFSLSYSPNNLHSLWDQGAGYLLDSVSRPLSATGRNNLSNRVADVEAAYPYTPGFTTIPNPMDWAVEGWGLAQTICYAGITNGTTPTTAYLTNVQATTKQRMAVGGQRLADLLNAIFFTNPPPAVLTLPATGTSNTTTTINATVNPNALTTTAWFEWGTTTNYGSQTAPVAVGSGTNALALTTNLVGFTQGVTNHYRVVATNSAGITRGNDLAFGSPLVTLIGPANITNECHTVFTDPGANNSAGFPVTVSGNMNTNAPGSYTLIYTGTNSLGGLGTASRTVVVRDTLPPVIIMSGNNPVSIALNSAFLDPGATALDACGGNLSVGTNSNVNLAVSGTYSIGYSATDGYGNSATNTRTVLVITPPTLVGVTRLGDGTFQFSFTSLSGASFTVFASSNLTLPLAEWSNLGPALESPIGSGQFQFTEPQATNGPQRFYQISSP